MVAVTDVLMFHGTPRWNAPALERQLLFLSSLFEVVPLDRLGEQQGRRRRVALTFDDGLRNNVTVAYPILRRLGIHATFFVCPGLIDRGRWLWNQEARARLRTLHAGELAALAADVGAPAEVEPFVEHMKRLDVASRRRVEQAVRRATRFFLASPAQREEFELATWQDLARLDPAVVTIGSHTLTHPILTSLAAGDVETEVAESRARIEARLKRPVEHFCYPNGDRDGVVVDCVRRHYRTAVTTVPGRVRPGADPHLLPRWSAPSTVLKTARILYERPQWRPAQWDPRGAASVIFSLLRSGRQAAR